MVGKNGFFISPDYGSKIVICSILTDAPLEYDKKYENDLCKKCTICDNNDIKNSFLKCPYGKEKNFIS